MLFLLFRHLFVIVALVVEGGAWLVVAFFILGFEVVWGGAECEVRLSASAFVVDGFLVLSVGFELGGAG